MMYKINLHFHSGDDFSHKKSIRYSTKEGIEYAAKCGFHALALTFHHQFGWNEELHEYARKKGVLLIKGTELSLRTKRGRGRKNHVIVLNCDASITDVHTFEELSHYRKKHPSVFVIAPHPYFYGNFSLKEHLERHIHLFDAIEHSWYYSSLFNRNKKGRAVAEYYNIPFIATSDTHHLPYIENDYALVDTEKHSEHALFDAIRKGKFENVTSPKKFFKDMVITYGKIFVKDLF